MVQFVGSLGWRVEGDCPVCISPLYHSTNLNRCLHSLHLLFPQPAALLPCFNHRIVSKLFVMYSICSPNICKSLSLSDCFNILWKDLISLSCRPELCSGGLVGGGWCAVELRLTWRHPHGMSKQQMKFKVNIYCSSGCARCYPDDIAVFFAQI